MEGVGARLGRSSTRYSSATHFNGPVRHWKKKWVPLSNPNSNNSSAAAANGNHSPILVYKWLPVSSSSTPANAVATPAKDSAAAQYDEQPRMKFRYVPIAVIKGQKQDVAAKSDEDSKPSETDQSPNPSLNAALDIKPDMNVVPLEETQALSNSDQDRAREPTST